jgi:hypothetical protein
VVDHKKFILVAFSRLAIWSVQAHRYQDEVRQKLARNGPSALVKMPENAMIKIARDNQPFQGTL